MSGSNYFNSSNYNLYTQQNSSSGPSNDNATIDSQNEGYGSYSISPHYFRAPVAYQPQGQINQPSAQNEHSYSHQSLTASYSSNPASSYSSYPNAITQFYDATNAYQSNPSTVPGSSNNPYSQSFVHTNPRVSSNHTGYNFIGAPSQSNNSLHPYDSISYNPPRTTTVASGYSNLESVMNGAGHGSSSNIGNVGDFSYLQDAIELLAQSPFDSRSNALGTSNRTTVDPASSSGSNYQQVLAPALIGGSNSQYYTPGSANLYSASGSSPSYGVHQASSPSGRNIELSSYSTTTLNYSASTGQELSGNNEKYGDFRQSTNISPSAYATSRHSSSNAPVGILNDWGSSCSAYNSRGQIVQNHDHLAQVYQGSLTSPAEPAAASASKSAPASAKSKAKPTPNTKTKPQPKPKKPRKPKAQTAGKASQSGSGTLMNDISAAVINAAVNGTEKAEQSSQSPPGIIGAPAGFPMPKSKLSNAGKMPPACSVGENKIVSKGKSPPTFRTLAKKENPSGSLISSKNELLSTATEFTGGSNSPKLSSDATKNVPPNSRITAETRPIHKAIPTVLKPIDCTTENLRNLLTKSRTEKPIKSNTSVKSPSTQPKYFSIPTDFSPSHSYRAAAAYSLLRTLSTELRLSPFSMQSFLNALTLPIPCRLLGEIHVRIIRVLCANNGMGTYSKHGAGQVLTIRRKTKLGDQMNMGKVKGETGQQNPTLAEEVISKRGGDNLFFLDNTSWPLFYEDYVMATEAKFLDEAEDDETFIDLRSSAMIPMDEIDLNPRAPPPRFLSRGNMNLIRNGSKIDSSAKRHPSEGWINRCPAGPLGHRNRFGRYICCPFHIVTAVKRAMQTQSPPPSSDNSPIMTTPKTVSRSRPEKSTSKKRGRPPLRSKSTQGKRQTSRRKGKMNYAESSSSSESDGSDDDEEFPAPKIRKESRSDVKSTSVTPLAPKSVGGLCRALNLDAETPTSSNLLQNGLPRNNLQMKVPSPNISTSSCMPLKSMLGMTKTPTSSILTVGSSTINSIIHPSIKQNIHPRQFEPIFVPPIPPPPFEENALLVADDVKKDLERYFLEGDLFKASKPTGIRGVKVECKVTHTQLSKQWKASSKRMDDLAELRVVMDDIIEQIEANGNITGTANSMKTPLCSDSLVVKSNGDTEEVKAVLEGILQHIEDKELNEPMNRMESGSEEYLYETQRARLLMTSFPHATNQISSSSKDQSTVEANGNTQVLMVLEGILQTIENNGNPQPKLSSTEDRRESASTDEFITHFTRPINHLRRGVPYHHLSIEDKLIILEFLLDELLTVQEISDELARRHATTDYLPSLYGKPPLQNEFDNMYNADECKICGMEGDLLCCDGCPGSFHRACLNLGHGRLPEGKWLCQECRLADSSKMGPLGADNRPLLGWFTVDDVEECLLEAQVPAHPLAPPTESLPIFPSNTQPQTMITSYAPGKPSEIPHAATCNLVPTGSTQAPQKGEIPSGNAPGTIISDVDLASTSTTTPENGAKNLATLQASTPDIFECRIPSDVEFLVSSGKVFARYKSSHEPFDPLKFPESPVRSVGKNFEFKRPSPPIPLSRVQLRELLKLLGPKFCLSLPWRHIKFEPKIIWPDIEEKDSVTMKCLITYQSDEKSLSEKNPEIYNPISYINNYRRAPPLPIVKAHQGQFQCPVIIPDIVNYPTKVNALTNTAYDLTSDALNKARRIAYLDPVQSVRDKMIKLERCLCDACLLDESWGTLGYGMDEDGWKKKVQKSRSIKSLSTLLVDLIDACSGKVFCKEWYELKENGADESESLAADEVSQEFSEVSDDTCSMATELTRRKWERCTVGDIIRLLRSDEGTMEKIFSTTLSSKKRGKSRISSECSNNDVKPSSPKDDNKEAVESPPSLQADLQEREPRSDSAREIIPNQTHAPGKNQNEPGPLQANQPNISSKDKVRDIVELSQTHGNIEIFPESTCSEVTKASAASSLKDSAIIDLTFSSTKVAKKNSMVRCTKCNADVQEDCGQCLNCSGSHGKRFDGCTNQKEFRESKYDGSDFPEHENVSPVAITKSKKKRVSRGSSVKSRRRSDRHNALRNQIEAFLKLNENSTNETESSVIELKLDKLEKALASDPSESYWTIAGRRMFEPRGSLPRPVVKRLGRKAGSARAPFVAYDTSYEVGETTVCHYWRKKALECVTFEDLVFCFRFLDSHIDKASIISCSTVATRKANSKQSSTAPTVRCHTDPYSGNLEYFVLPNGKNRGRWQSEKSIDVSTFISYKYDKKKAYRMTKGELDLKRKIGELEVKRKTEAEVRKKEEERKVKEAEVRKQENEKKRREVEMKKKEADMRRMEAEVRRKEAEARMLEMRKKEVEMRKREAAMRKREADKLAAVKPVRKTPQSRKRKTTANTAAPPQAKMSSIDMRRTHESAFQIAYHRHMTETVNLLKESALRGEASVPVEPMTMIRKKNLAVLRNSAELAHRHGGKAMTEEDLTRTIAKAEGEALNKYVSENSRQSNTN
ncbi:hypothetical protein ACHAXS_011820 [Conticribra weissflogii]